MSERRVVITGIGVISAIGSGREGFLSGLRAGRSGAGPVTAFDTEGFLYGQSCEVPDFVDDEQSEYGRATRMAAAASRMAVQDAGLDLERLRGDTGAIVIGTTEGDGRDLDELTAIEVAKGLADLDPLLARRARMSRMPVAVADELGLEDVELMTLPNVCAAGTYAIGYALDAIRSGDADYALCGGADAVCRRTFATFYRMGAMSRDVCRPFDEDRTGVVFGEGAAMMVLEPLDTALARGAVILAEVLDYNLNCDAFHPTRPVGESVAECMRGALVNAEVAPGEVDLVIAHGTGTRANDPMESAALAEVFEGGAIPPVSAIKSMIGHTMGAASAHSCVAAVLAMEHGFLPPTINLRTQDPECPVDCVPNAARAGTPRTVLVNALGLGGANAAVVLRQFREETPQEVAQ